MHQMKRIIKIEFEKWTMGFDKIKGNLQSKSLVKKQSRYCALREYESKIGLTYKSYDLIELVKRKMLNKKMNSFIQNLNVL